jgi:hypothetical protein
VDTCDHTRSWSSAFSTQPHLFIMSTIVASASSAVASATARPQAPPQAGVLEGVNPVHFDAKNPIILFIVQVNSRSYTFALVLSVDRVYHRHQLSSFSAAFLVGLFRRFASLVLSLRLSAGSSSVRLFSVVSQASQNRSFLHSL